MMEISGYVALVLALLGLLLLLLRKTSSAEVSGKSLEAAAAANSHLICIPPREVMERLFAEEDMEYVTKLRSPEIARLLRVERRRLGLAWMREARGEAGRIVAMHVR